MVFFMVSGPISRRRGFSESNIVFQRNLTMSSLTTGNCWNLPPSNSFLSNVWEEIRSQSFSPEASDIIIWKPNKKVFTVRSASAAFINRMFTAVSFYGTQQFYLDIGWSLGNSLRGKICTQSYLQSRKWSLASRCILCKVNEEDFKHIFLNCSYAKWHREVFFSQDWMEASHC